MFNISSFYSAWRRFSHGSLLYIAIPIAILLFMLQSSKERRRYTSWVICILIIILYNPLSYSVLVKAVSASSYRIFWLLPGWAAFTYILISFIRWIPSRRIHPFLCIVVAFVFMLLAMKANAYSLTLDNIYQIPEDTIELADQMTAIMDKRGLEEAVLYGNYDFVANLRQYSSRFILHLEPRNHSKMEESAGLNTYSGLGQYITTGFSPIDKDYASDILLDNGVYFIVLHRELAEPIAFLGEMGWSEITGNDSYTVLCQDQTINTEYE